MTRNTMLVLVPALILTAVLGAQSSSRRSGGAVVRESWGGWTESGWARLRVDYQGQFELTDDGGDVKSVSPGGSIEVSSRGWLSLFGRRYIVRGNPDGTTSRRYLVGAAERPLDPAARAWIAETFRRLSEQGFGGDVRFAQTLAKDGPAAALDAIQRISSDSVQARYYKMIFAGAAPPPPIVQRALVQATRDIGSDYERAEVLIAMTTAVSFDAAIARTFGEASVSIGSDYEHARVLLAALDTQTRSAALTETVVSSAVRIGSDYEKARVLLKAIETQMIDDVTRPKLIDAAGTIGSEHERSRVLAALAVR